MKLSKILVLVATLLIVACKSSDSGETGRQYSGIIEPAGITTYQYGTHRLQTENDFYALTSDSVNLTNYEGEKVKLTASQIEGYPVDGGPVYLRVTKVMKE